MRKPLAMLALGVCATLFMAVDWPIYPMHLQVHPSGLVDAGAAGATWLNRLTNNDGGRYALVDTQELNDWVMVIRCEGPQAVRYAFSTDGGLATTANQLLDYDRTFEIPVNHGNSDKYRYLSLRTEDAGVPNCVVLKAK